MALLTKLRLPPEVESYLHVLELSGSSPESFTVETLDEKFLKELWSLWLITNEKGRYVEKEDSEENLKSRVRIMRAIGQCKTLKKVFFWSTGVIWYGSVRVPELEALLQPLRLNTSLISLDMCYFNMSSAAACQLVAGFLRTNSTLEELRVRNTGIGPKGLGYIAHALTANGRCPLQVLDMSNNSIGDEEGAKHMNQILAALPNLRKLKIERIGMTKGGAKTLGEVVMNHKTLELLQIDDRKFSSTWSDEGENQDEEVFQHPLSIFLASAFDRLHGTKSITNLQLGFCQSQAPIGPRLDTFAKFLQADESLLTHLSIRLGHVKKVHQTHLDSDDWPKFLRTLKHTLTLKTLEFWNEDWSTEASIALTDFIKANTPVEQMTIWFVGGGLCEALFRSLIGNTNLRLMRICGGASDGSPWTMQEKDSIALAELIEANTPLRTLRTSNMIQGLWKEVFKSLRKNTNLTYLDLVGCKGFNNTAFKELKNALQVNSTLQEIILLGTEWGSDGKAALVKEALLQNKKQKAYLAAIGDNVPGVQLTGPSIGRVFFCGEVEAGMQQLTTMLQIEKTKWPLVRKLKKYFKHQTKGIEAQVIWNIDGMDIYSWDLAGIYVGFPKVHIS